MHKEWLALSALLGLSACATADGMERATDNAGRAVERVLALPAGEIAAPPPQGDEELPAEPPAPQAPDNQTSGGAPASAPRLHVAQRGETLETIAARYGYEVVTLERMNGLTRPYQVRPGDIVVLPNPAVLVRERPRYVPPPYTPPSYPPSPASASASPPPPTQVTTASGPPREVTAYAPPPPTQVTTASGPPREASAYAPPPSTQVTTASGPPREASAYAPPPSTQVTTASTPPRVAYAPPPPTQATTASASPPPPIQVTTVSASRDAAAYTPPPQVSARVRGRPGFYQRPAPGPLLARFGAYAGGGRLEGVELAATPGTPIVAAADGVVVYAGNDVAAYGNLILIRHADGGVTAYGYAGELLAREGARVRRGDTIANAGDRGRIFFQVRRGAESVDPVPLIGD